MTAWRRRRGVIAAVAASVALLTACTGGDPADSGAVAGEPVAGGAATVLQMTEPRSLDPAVMLNSVTGGAIVGNALYGTLLVDDPQTGDIEFSLAEGLSSDDAGKTFTLELREGLVYSDGSPLTAEDVQYNWERIKDPTRGSASLAQASLIESTEVVDDRTLSVSLVDPLPSFAQVVLGSSLNWIAKPEVLEEGQEAIDANPIGAGPFTLEKWARQDVIELVRNESYGDAPKPYLDRLTVRTSTDGAQRYNTVIGGGADLAMEAEWMNLARAESEAGVTSQTYLLSGGSVFVFNTSRPPFDDVRARRAVALALDLDAFNVAIWEGDGVVPETLFDESSPFHSDVALREHDPERAQDLLDELAAEGAPLSFSFTAFASPQGLATGEVVQAQLAAFENVDVAVDVVEIADIGGVNARGDFQMGIGGVSFVDPEPQLRLYFHGGSPGNVSRIDDDALSAALDAGRAATGLEERRAAYATVQERLAVLMPVVFYSRSPQGVVFGDQVGGVRQYGFGALLPAELWIQP